MSRLRSLALALALVPAGAVVCAPSSAHAAPPDASDALGPLEIEQTLSPNPSNIGDALVLEMEVRYPKGYRVNLPTGLTMGKAEVLSVEEDSPRRADGGSVKTFRINLQAFEAEAFDLPPVMLTYTDPDGQVTTADAPAVAVQVEALTANEADPERKGEDPPVSLTYPNVLAEMIAWAALAALVFGSILAVLFLVLRGRKPTVTPVIVRAPHELALEALRGLETRRLGMLEAGEYQDFYLELTSIAKQYVQARFGVDVVERTTDELHLQLRRERERLTGLEPDELLSFLREADLIKFARLAPTPEETERSLQSIEKIVLQTRPLAATPPPAAPPTSAGVAATPTPTVPEPEPEPEPPQPPEPEPPEPEPEPEPPQPEPPQPEPPKPERSSDAPAGPTAPDMRPGPRANPFPKDDRKDVA